ncbi:MAG: 3-dehydroquinate synthase II [Candidatus Bathycorpusculaceae bacterium]
MKEIWVSIDEKAPQNVNERLLELATDVCDAVYFDGRPLKDIKKTGIKTASSSGNCDIYVLDVFNVQKVEELKSLGKTLAVEVTVKRKEDEERAIKAAHLRPDYILVHCPDWKVIPLENLIAEAHGKSKLIAEVLSAEDAKMVLETLEIGVDGVVLKTSDVNELMKVALAVKGRIPKLKLVPVKVVKVKRIRIGARVCVDTCDLMKKGEGLLLGCQSACLFLVEAEVHDNPFVKPRPFRVNAGPVSLYTLCALDKTKYLSELGAGDEILIVDRNGNARLTNIARIKIEWRPMTLVEAEYEEKRFKIIVQTAETIRLVSETGSIPITELNAGNNVLAHISEGGRHFGTLVKEETVMEL